MTNSPGKLWGLRRLADNDGFWKMVAMDQRTPIAQGVLGATVRPGDVSIQRHPHVDDNTARLLTPLAGLFIALVALRNTIVCGSPATSPNS